MRIRARRPTPLRVLPGLVALASIAAPVLAQRPEQTDLAAYYRAVGEHFDVPSNEIMILSEWRLLSEEIPVVLYVAGRGGISPEAVVALRRAGRSWSDVVGRYGLDAASFHVPLDGSPGSLAQIYDAYGSRPAVQWSAIVLQDADIVALVNLRLLAGVLHATPAAVVQARDRSGSWVAAYRALARG